MIRRLAVPAVAALFLFGAPLALDVGMISNSAAATYPVHAAPGRVSKGTVGPGGKVEFGGTGFTAFASIAISISTATGRGQAAPIFDAAVTSIKADASGSFSLPLTLHTPGVNTIRGSGLKAGGHSILVVTAVVTVTGSKGAASASPSSTASATASSGAGGGSGGGSGSGSLPKTGADSVGPELWLGGGLLVLGGAAVLASVARRRTRVAS